MIVVRVELWSAVTGKVTELARMHVSNVGGTMASRNYHGEAFTGRSTEALDRHHVQREGDVASWPSQRVHVWNLVAAMLKSMRYGQ